MLVAYTLEILPFAIRVKGFALMVSHFMTPSFSARHTLRFSKNVVVSLSLAFNQLVDPWAFNAIGWRYVGLSLTLKRSGLIDYSISSTVDGWALNWPLLSSS